MLLVVTLFYLGYQVLVKKAGMDEWLDFFITEADIYNPVRQAVISDKQYMLMSIVAYFSFKVWLDLAYLRIRWKLQCNRESWKDMIEKRLGKENIRDPV